MFDNKLPQMLNGMRVVESRMATTSEPVRTHKLTRSQLKHLEKHMFKGITYHDRIQKKWNKRFGFKQVPGCFIVDTSKLTFGDIGPGDKVILAHPTVVERLKKMDLSDFPINKQHDCMEDRYGALRKQSRDPRTVMHSMIDSSIFNRYPVRNPNAAVSLDVGA